MHEKVLEHLHKKDAPLNELSVFVQPEAWEIMTEQIESGQYHFHALEEGYVDKRNGEPMSYAQASGRNFEDVRKIYMFTDTVDKVIAHAIYLIYYRRYIGRTSEYCVSYKSGISTSKVAKHLSVVMNADHQYDGFKADIHHYFDEVNMQTIESMLKSMDDGSALDRVLWELYHDDRVIINGEVTHKHRGLIQGCAFACLLADLCLTDIDEVISKMNVIYYRYSDDIICLGKDAPKALKTVGRMLQPKGLALHPKKLDYIHGDRMWFEFLGFKFKRDMITVSAKTLKTLEHEIKVRTISITREKHNGATKAEIKKMIRELQYYFFTAYAKDSENFGMGVYLFGACNVAKDIFEIETYIKDCLRAAYTNRTEIYGLGSVDGKDYTVKHGVGKNVANNRAKTHNDTFENGDLLLECGWVSLNQMYRAYHINKDVFGQMVWQMANANC